MFRILRVVLVALILLVPRSEVIAQETPTDTSAVLYRLATDLVDSGRHDLAVPLFELILERYSDSDFAAQAAEALQTSRGAESARAGRRELMIWNTFFGAWLGLAIPAAFGSNDDAAYGAGLLIGPTVGYLAARSYANRHLVSSGQARLGEFGALWGTFQFFGWRDVLDIGDEEFCTQFGCHSDNSEESGFAAAVAGGLVGTLVGNAIGRATGISKGTANAINAASLWGTWYGAAFAGIADIRDEDAVLGWVLAGGDVGLLAGAVGLPRHDLSSGQVSLISALGIAGGLAGLGLDLLFDVDDDQTAIAIPLVTSTIGLGLGWQAAMSNRELSTESGRLGTSLFDLTGGQLSVSLPLPHPRIMRAVDSNGRTRSRPGIGVPIISASF